MSAHFRPWFILLVCAVLSTGIAGCSRESSSPSSSRESGTDRSGADAQAASPDAAASPQAARADQSAPQNNAPSQPAQIPPPKVEVPRDVYVPTQEEIQRAFADVLAQSVQSMADTPERTQWYQQQANQLQTLKVQQCSGSYAGTASVCNITFAGRAIQVKVMLTTSGWVLVK